MILSQFSTWDKTQVSTYLFGPAIAEDPLTSAPTHGGERGGGAVLCVWWGEVGFARHLSLLFLSLYQYFLSTPCHVPPLLVILQCSQSKGWPAAFSPSCCLSGEEITAFRET